MTRSDREIVPGLAACAALTMMMMTGCGDNIQSLGPDNGNYEVVEASAAPRVVPGGSLAVSVTLRNAGSATWPGGTTIAYQGDASWGATSWRTTGAVAPNATVTFTQDVSASTQIGLHALTWRGVGARGEFGPDIVVRTEVTCSDGIFCNGDERYVAGACVAGAPPCDDAYACTTEQCNEEAGLCAWVLGTDCPACAVPDCEPDCMNRMCGDDGCGGSCGTCGADLACVDGVCSEANQPGTCKDPLPLLAPDTPLLGTHVIQGDTATGLHVTAPACNTASAAREIVYTFTTTEVMGIDARMEGHDTVLDLRLAECASAAASVACSDDATPPGNYGSRVATELVPGTYYLIADGYGVEEGPFTLTVRFTEGCVPACDGRFCGDDGCGSECGACNEGEVCTALGRCKMDPCIPACEGRECGNDGCGGSCGACTGDELCVEAEGVCRAFAVCNHEQPVCEGGCGPGQYCGFDCACHDVSAPKPDLVVGAERLASEVMFETRMFDEASCAVFEGCVGDTGERKLLRFTVASVNQGRGTFEPPPPEARPDLFEYSLCHGHYHFKGFAEYALVDASGNVVVPGRKQAYCLTDSEQSAVGPGVACEAAHDCSSQGLQAGWADIYSYDLDCQWLDITDVPPGQYVLQVALNPGRLFEEVSYDNNRTSVPVTIE